MYRVVWEIELDADTPLEAAKEALEIMQDWMSLARQFYVQDEDNDSTLYSVDLLKKGEDAVLPVDEYLPLIKARQVMTGK